LKLLVLYHYYHPDDVVSASHFTDLCVGLSQREYEVEVWPANRSCHNAEARYSLKEEVCKGVKVKRLWRPSLRQYSFFGRIINSVWMLSGWWLRLLFSPGFKPDVIITGTDPLFTVMLSPLLKLIRPKTKIVHWCFDLYPEAAIADELVKEGNPLVKLVKWGMKQGYQKCDLVINIGSCMWERLKVYHIQQNVTLTPWALEEPTQVLSIDADERKELFGDSQLCLLYSGNLGRAHDFYLMVKLSRLLRGFGAFAYSIRGSRWGELKLAVNPEDTNVRFVSFAPPEKLSVRLSATDVHIVSLRTEWTGMVVPSKFFGALAIGRPVLFEGDPASSIARWILEYKVGWVLREDNLDKIKDELLEFSRSKAQKTEMFRHCHEVYRAHFSKKAVVDGWNSELQKLLS
jgi:colanic acid biosynthesis glycosyl transferase WcaI